MSNTKWSPQPATEERRSAERLEAWKEIAAYLKRDVSTVQRWEKRERLPVYRHVHEKLGTVYAYKSELDAWRDNRRSRLERPGRAVASRQRLVAWLGCTVLFLAGAIPASWHYLAHWRTSARAEIATRRVWTGPGVDRLGSPSPDGRYCSYTDPATGDLAVRDLRSGEQRHLTRGGPRRRWEYARLSSISPDGKQIAYSWFNEDLFYDLRLIRLDGSDRRIIYYDRETFYVEPADWSPDGKHILALLTGKDRLNRLVLIAAADGSVRLLKTLGWRFPLKMNFAPDGRHIVYDFPPREDSGERDIFLMEAAGGREIPLIEHRSHDFLLGWAPDGKTILFASDRAGTVDAWSIRVASGKPEGVPELVKKDIGRIWPLGFTRTGSYFYALQVGMTDTYLAALDRATGRLLGSPMPLAQRFVGSNESPDWSRDGRFLAYVSQPVPGTRWPGTRIIIRSLQDQAERELWLNLNYVALLRWAADGRSLLTTGADNKDRQGLFRVDARTGQVTPIVQGTDPRAFFHELACSPDGRKVFYKLRNWTAEPSRLMVRDLESGREKEFLPSVYRFALSPDGRRLAFSNYLLNGMQALMVIPAEGGKAAELCRRPGQIVSIAWTPDGRWLLFSRRDELWRISVAGGEPERLAAIKENLRELRIRSDGVRIAFTAGERRGELWVMENFLPAVKAAR